MALIQVDLDLEFRLGRDLARSTIGMSARSFAMWTGGGMGRLAGSFTPDCFSSFGCNST
jgi:hypothetical protein